MPRGREEYAMCAPSWGPKPGLGSEARHPAGAHHLEEHRGTIVAPKPERGRERQGAEAGDQQQRPRQGGRGLDRGHFPILCSHARAAVSPDKTDRGPRQRVQAAATRRCPHLPCCRLSAPKFRHSGTALTQKVKVAMNSLEFQNSATYG